MVFSKLETYNIFKISISRIYFLLFVFVFFFHFSAKDSISQEIDQIVLGADSVIDLEGELISKPENREEKYSDCKNWKKQSKE